MSVLAPMLAAMHGGGSHARGVIDIAVVVASIALVVWVFWLCIRYFVSPGEEDPAHIKRIDL